MRRFSVNRILLFFLSALILAMPGRAFAKTQELILKAKLFKVEAFDPKNTVDAVDEASMGGTMPTATAVFLIKKVSKGELPAKTERYPSALSQAEDAVKEKDFLKIVTMDFKKPDAERESKPHWFAVGLQSPLETLKVISWSDLPESDYRLAFSKEKNAGGWILRSAQLQS